VHPPTILEKSLNIKIKASVLPFHSLSFGFFWQALLNDSLAKKRIVLESRQRRELIVPKTSFDTCRKIKAFNDHVMIPKETDNRILINVDVILPLKLKKKIKYIIAYSSALLEP